MARRWKPSRTAAREFAQTMGQIEQFCREHGIDMSASGDSYYFTLNGTQYRVSNHSVEASNRGAYDPVTGERRRDLYHAGGRQGGVVYIHAGKTRIMDIYHDLAAGYALDGRGNRI